MSESPAPVTLVSPAFVHNVGGSDRQQVGQESDTEAASGSSNIPERHGASSDAIEDGDEEVQPQRLVKTPYTPTKAEMAEHRASGHIPHRRWCPDCVEGFGREWAHTGSGIERDFPLISCDYLYITQSGVFLRTELGEEEREAALRVLVLFCGHRKACSRMLSQGKESIPEDT